MTPTFDAVVTDEGTVFEPWTDGWAVGFKVTHRNGSVRYVYLNPSSTDSEGVPYVFAYYGSSGDPAYDEEQVYIPV